MHYSQRVHFRSNSRIRAWYKDYPNARGEHSVKDTRDCWSNSRALCEKFSARGATDLSLATPLATLLKTVFVPFFLTRNAFIKTWNRSNQIKSLNQIKRETFQARASALPRRQARVRWARKRYTRQNELRQNNDMLLGYMSVKQTFLSS